MTGSNSPLTRRTAIKGAAGLGAAAIGGGALFMSAQPAAAAEFTISDADPVTTDDGTLNYVRVQADHELTWDGFDTDVEYIRYVDKVTVRPNDENVTRTINDSTSAHLDDWSGDGDSNGWGGDGEYTSGSGKAGTANADIDWNVIGDPDASDPAEGGARSIEEPADLLHLLAEDTDGETKTSKVVLEKIAILLDGNENELGRTTSSDSFTVEVINEESTVDAGGSGNASAGGTNEEP